MVCVARIDSSGNLAVGDTVTQSFRLKVLNGAGLLADLQMELHKR